MNERPPCIEPHQGTVREEEVGIINEDEVNPYEAIDSEEKTHVVSYSGCRHRNEVQEKARQDRKECVYYSVP